MKRSRLSNMEVLFLQLEAHMKFICPECGESFQTQQLWRQHLNFQHDYLCKTPENLGFIEVDDKYHECIQCNQLVADGRKAIALLQYHRFLHLPHKYTYHCRYCTKTFMRKRICFEHLCYNHEAILGSKLVEQATKSQIFKNKKGVNSYKNSIAKDNPEFYLRCICPQCGVRLTTFKRLLDHINDKHSMLRSDYGMLKITGTNDNFCSICKKLMNTNDREKLQRHYFMHLPYKINFQCTYCNVRRPFKTEILHHFIRTHLQEFEKHRIFMVKPKEFGIDMPNEKLDQELDFLLKYGNRIGSPSCSKFASTTMKPKTQKFLSSTLIPDKEKTNTNDILQTAIDKSYLDLDKEIASSSTTVVDSLNRSSNIRKELDALCAEIFKDIEAETPTIESTTEFENSIVNTTNINDANCNNNNNNEEIVSIEINTLNEDEINENGEISDEVIISQSTKRQKLNDFSSSDIEIVTCETFNSLKLLYNAKVVHLCPQCGENFTDQKYWREHVLRGHQDVNRSISECFQLLSDKNSNLCLTCNNILYTTVKTELQKHRFSHMPYNAYLKCMICSKCKTNKSKMLEHLKKKHDKFLQNEIDLDTVPEDTQSLASTVKTNTRNPETELSTGKNNDFIPLLTHLQNARVRLNRIAAEYGL